MKTTSDSKMKLTKHFLNVGFTFVEAIVSNMISGFVNFSSPCSWKYIWIRMTHLFSVLTALLFSCRDGAVVRALAYHQCGPGLIPRSDVMCGLSLLVCIDRFSPGTPVSPLPKNQHLT